MNTDYSTLRAQAQEYLFNLECQGRQAIDYVDGIKVAIYNLVNTTIYWFIDLETEEEFLTRDFNNAVSALAYAVQ